MTWIDAIIQNLLAIVEILSPVRIIMAYERGVVFRLGVPHRVMEAGLHWMIPCKVEILHRVTISEETCDLLVQSITTADDIPVTFSVNLVFRVVEPTLYLVAVYDFNKSIEAFARQHLNARARMRTWEQLRTEQKELERSLEGTLSTRLQKWGAAIVSVGFTDCSRAKAFRLFGETKHL